MIDEEFVTLSFEDRRYLSKRASSAEMENLGLVLEQFGSTHFFSALEGFLMEGKCDALVANCTRIEKQDKNIFISCLFDNKHNPVYFKATIEAIADLFEDWKEKILTAPLFPSHLTVTFVDDQLHLEVSRAGVSKEALIQGPSAREEIEHML